MAEDLIQQALNPEEPISGSFEPERVTQEGEKAYLGQIKKRNKHLLLDGLTKGERERIGKAIIEKYNDAKPSHDDICDKVDEWDECSRMIRKEVMGSDGQMPNYRMPISLVVDEVIHANVMNTFFSPKDIMRVIPTEASDVPKVNNISTFGNWSTKNELDIFNKIDRLFRASNKVGESPYLMYWKKEYGVDIKRVPAKGEDGQPIYDDETKEPVFKTIEEPKLIYNAPCLEVLNRKDYIQPKDAVMGVLPEWEGVIHRQSYDSYLRDQLQGKVYADTLSSILGWSASSEPEVQKTDLDGNDLAIAEWSKEFLDFYGRLRINVIKADKTDEEEAEAYELEAEFIAKVHIKTQTLCAIRKNTFPLQERPIGVDYFEPDDTGRRAGLGIYEKCDSLQKCYDALFNEFVYGVQLSNQPIVFFTPFGNQRAEKQKLQKGYMYPTSDPKSVNLFQFPGPTSALQMALELVRSWVQFLFGISEYAAGMESTIDPSAPAKKAEIVVEQGNVRLNLIIKRKNDTLKDIFRRWYLLYQANMPSNKFMRIAGEGEGDNPWKFEPISYEDFNLKSLPDFELTGNILNSNKQLEMQKSIAIYNMLVTNVFFNPATTQGLQALQSLTKWLIDKMDDTSLSRFLPKVQNEGILYTPEEENAVMLQGTEIVPTPNDDDMQHIKSHANFMNNPTCPEEIKPKIGQHIKDHLQQMQRKFTQNMAMQQTAMDQPPMQQGGQDAGPSAGGFGAQGATPGMVPQQPTSMG